LLRPIPYQFEEHLPGGADYRVLPPRERRQSASGAVGQAGGVLLTETITLTGLGRELATALAPWRKASAVHDPAKVITDLALTLALGGDCLADIALPRCEPGVYGLVASDATVSRTIDALAKDAGRVEGDQHGPFRGTHARVGAGRDRRTRSRRELGEPVDRGPGRDLGDVPLREGAGETEFQAGLRIPSAVLLHRPRATWDRGAVGDDAPPG